MWHHKLPTAPTPLLLRHCVSLLLHSCSLTIAAVYPKRCCPTTSRHSTYITARHSTPPPYLGVACQSCCHPGPRMLAAPQSCPPAAAAAALAAVGTCHLLGSQALPLAAAQQGVLLLGLALQARSDSTAGPAQRSTCEETNSLLFVSQVNQPELHETLKGLSCFVSLVGRR